MTRSPGWVEKKVGNPRAYNIISYSSSTIYDDGDKNSCYLIKYCLKIYSNSYGENIDRK